MYNRHYRKCRDVTPALENQLKSWRIKWNILFRAYRFLGGRLRVQCLGFTDTRYRFQGKGIYGILGMGINVYLNT